MLNERSSFAGFISTAFVLILFLTCLFSATIVQAQVSNVISMQLLDMDENPLSGLLIKAWQVDTPKMQSSAYSAKNGTALLKLPPGRYYFTANVTKLKYKPSYAANLKNCDETTLYYISHPIDVTDKSEPISFTIDNTNYIDVADIEGVKGFHLYLSQKDLGIQTPVYAGTHHKWLRLYLPTSLTYTIEDIDDTAFRMKLPFYAAPRLQFTIFSSQ